MQVEVNEQNIILYGLAQLTGNSVETLMARAKEAENAGHILCVEVPDNTGVDKIIRQNLFESAGSTPVPDDEIEHESLLMDGYEVGRYRVTPTGVSIIDVVQGEVTDSHILEEDEDGEDAP